MADMIGTELQLQTIAGGHMRRSHHPGIVDQQIDPVMLNEKSLGKKLDAGHLAQIAFHQFDIGVRDGGFDCHHRSLALGHIAHRDDNMRALRRHRPRGFLTEAGCAAGDDHQLARQVDAVEHFVRSGGGSEIVAAGHAGLSLISGASWPFNRPMKSHNHPVLREEWWS